MTLLTQASHQLFTRPGEEHFESFPAIQAAARDQRARCNTFDAREEEIRLIHQDEKIRLRFGDVIVDPHHYLLTQLAQQASVPVGLLARLHQETVVSVLNQCLEKSRKYRTLLTDGDAGRAITSAQYERVWDDEIFDEIHNWLIPQGFVPAIPTINTDDIGTNMLGNNKPALFRSDRDSFVFFYSDRPTDGGGPYGGLRKGLVIYNSEVGAKSLGYSEFLFRDMCANFLIWGAQSVTDKKARHTGSVREFFGTMREDIRRISAEVEPESLRAIDKAATTLWVEGDPHTDHVRGVAAEKLVKKTSVPKKLAPQVIEAVFRPENPRELSYWGVVNGITTMAKEPEYAADRVAFGAAAAQVMDLLVA